MDDAPSETDPPPIERTDELPPDVRALLELVAERLNLGGPMARFTVDLSEGRVKFLTRQERIRATDLERF